MLVAQMAANQHRLVNKLTLMLRRNYGSRHLLRVTKPSIESSQRLHYNTNCVISDCSKLIYSGRSENRNLCVNTISSEGSHLNFGWSLLPRRAVHLSASNRSLQARDLKSLDFGGDGKKQKQKKNKYMVILEKGMS